MSFLTLVSAFVLTDLSLVAVYNNSHISKPLFYKISELGATTKEV